MRNLRGDRKEDEEEIEATLEFWIREEGAIKYELAEGAHHIGRDRKPLPTAVQLMKKKSVSE